jgi:hypothetical protein
VLELDDPTLFINVTFTSSRTGKPSHRMREASADSATKTDLAVARSHRPVVFGAEAKVGLSVGRPGTSVQARDGAGVARLPTRR